MSDLAELYAKLQASETCKSLLKKHLTQERYEELKDKKTSFGGTLADCIRSGEWLIPSTDPFCKTSTSPFWTILVALPVAVEEPYERFKRINEKKSF